jgi:hypothetical protein
MIAKEPDERFLAPGTKVRRDYLLGGDTPATEYGVVVHCWMDEEVRAYDCLVAFFGEYPPPDGQPDQKPYILRYFVTSLEPLQDWPSA